MFSVPQRKGEEPSPETLIPPKSSAVAANPVKEPVKEKKVEKKEIKDKIPQSTIQAPVTKKTHAANSTLTVHTMRIKKSDGLLFYNPRRKNELAKRSISSQKTDNCHVPSPGSSGRSRKEQLPSTIVRSRRKRVFIIAYRQVNKTRQKTTEAQLSRSLK